MNSNIMKALSIKSFIKQTPVDYNMAEDIVQALWVRSNNDIGRFYVELEKEVAKLMSEINNENY